MFSEPLVAPPWPRRLAADPASTTAVLDPIEGLGDDDGRRDYLSLMQQNLAALQQANGCS